MSPVTPPYVVPAPVRPGDTVAVLSASGPTRAESLEQGLELLKGWDVEVDVLATSRTTHPDFDYLAGTDEARTADLTKALTDDRYAAVIAAKGGYGAQRVLEHMDWDAVRAVNPRPRHLVGFSDVTALQEALLCQLGWASWYAAMPATAYFRQDSARESLRRALFAPHEHRVLDLPYAETVVPGVAEGVLIGGCAALLASSIGTDTCVPADGALLFMEDVDEDLANVDGLFTQLRRSGYLDGVRGVLLGTFNDLDKDYDDAGLRRLAADRFGGLGVPVITGVDVGHGGPLQALPIGQRARLDTASRRLELLGD